MEDTRGTENKKQDVVNRGEEMQENDPLLSLAGTLKSDVTSIGERHDDYIRDALLAELWGDENE